VGTSTRLAWPGTEGLTNEREEATAAPAVVVLDRTTEAARETFEKWRDNMMMMMMDGGKDAKGRERRRSE
jgi:hypothetical protein